MYTGTIPLSKFKIVIYVLLTHRYSGSELPDVCGQIHK
jgi:hypothetical protein